MSVRNQLESNTETPFLGKEGEALLTLWEAGMEWSARVGMVVDLTTLIPVPPPVPSPTDPK